MGFDLAHYMEEKQRAVDAALDQVLPPETEWPATLHRAMRYSVFSGGKRIRPVLCIASCAACGGSSASAMPAAAAIELIHAYTLVHDDLPAMDNDAVRRGRPSCHAAFGEADAILTGDALQTLAFGTLSTASSVPVIRLISELADAAGSTGIAGGQAEDISTSTQAITAREIERIHLKKTAALFRCSTRAGALCARASEKQIAALSVYGESLGLAFQITDDLLDADTTGPCGGLEKVSCLRVYDRNFAQERAEQMGEKARRAINGIFEKDTEPLEALAMFSIRRNS
ncbi:MAG: polyprenyl synthetase family protein [Kiritimatiellia bacterium]